MTFLFLNQYGPPDPSPTARLLGDLAAHLESDGHKVIIVSQQQHYFGRPARGWRRLLREIWALLKITLEGARARPKPEIILALSSPPGLLPVATLVALKHGVPLAHWAMDLYPELAINLAEINIGWLSRTLTRVMGWGYARASLIIALDEDMAGHLRNKYGVDARILHPWPARLAAQKISPPAKESSPGAKLAADKWTWLYSGNLGRAHEWRALIDTQAELEKRGLPIQLLFEGGGALWSEARAYSKMRALKNCLWTGYVSETDSFRTLTESALIVATQKKTAQGLLWPSKLARIIPISKPLLWLGPTNGAIAQSLKDRPATASFEPDSLKEIADWIQYLWRHPEAFPPQESTENIERIYAAQMARGVELLERWLKELAPI